MEQKGQQGAYDELYRNAERDHRAGVDEVLPYVRIRDQIGVVGEPEETRRRVQAVGAKMEKGNAEGPQKRQ